MRAFAEDDDAAAVDFQSPTRPLKSVILPGDLCRRVADLVHEWRRADKLARYGMRPRNRILLHGPSGNGKTTLAQAIATELSMPLACVQYSALVSQWAGDTHHRITRVFDESVGRPCVLFFDEADSLCGSRINSENSLSRERNLSVNTLLLELDRMPATSVVIFATNFAEVLDGAMRRRVTLSLELPAPDADDLRRLVDQIRRQNPLWPLDGFDVADCGATSFAACEQAVIDHAREIILRDDFDPLHLEDRLRSAWLREQVEKDRDCDAVSA